MNTHSCAQKGILLALVTMGLAACASLPNAPSTQHPGDTTPPTVSVTAPSNGATISGMTTLTATASDNVGVTSMQFRVDGTNVGAAAGGTPYTLALDTTKYGNGAHTISAVAADAAGNQGTSANVSVTVTNTPPDTTPPTVTITAPSGGATLSGTTTLTATAADNVGVTSVQFRVDGANFGAADTSAPYSISLNTTTLTNGTHTISAVAADAAGNQGTSANVTITVTNTAPDTTPPTVTITAPSGGATINGTTTLTATAADNVGVTSVQFRVDGANFGAADTSAPYSISLNTTTLTNGTHTISAVAADAAGNQGTSANVTITVTNTAPDTTPPTVTITAPSGGATINGTTTLTATAADNVGVTSVQFRVDGANFGAADTSAPYSISLNTTTLTNGTHTISAVAADAAGNQGTSANVTITVTNTAPDTTPPTVTITAPSGGATINGTTTLTATAADNVGVTSVQFRVDGANFGAADTSAPYSISLNTTTLTNGTHTISAVAADAAGNQGTSANVTITVTNTAPDTTPPTVTITAPSGGATINGTTTLTATAADNVGVTSVQFRVDGANFGAADTSAPYSISLNTTTLTNGTHTISAVAADAAGNQGTSANVTITVTNTAPDTTPPTVTITAPSGGATINGTTTLTATAADNVGVTSVQFRVDGANFGAADTSAPYSISLNTTTLTNGTHTISAVAADAAGNQGTSANVTVTVTNTPPDTTPPTVTITAPSGGATINGTTTLTATASDNVGVTSVQFRIDGTNFGAADTSAPYSVALDTTTLSNGTHTISAVAVDAAGNQGTSANVTVTVNNTASGSFSGPLRVSSTNPRYFTDGTGKAIFLAGSHTWPDLEDMGFPAPVTFDYTSYLNFMKGHNYNLMHLWTEFFSNDGPTYGPIQFVAGPFPWSRPGPGVANDGQPKYDFTQLNQAYFDRLRARAIQAGQNGIYVSIYLFNGYENQFSVSSTDGNPFENSNNISGVNCPDTCPNDNSRIPAQVWTYEKNYIHKVIDTVNDLDNVLYMTSDESGAPYSTSWQYSVIAEVKSYEATKAKQHPVGMSFQYQNGTDQTLYNSAADWVSPAYGQGGLNTPSAATGQCPTTTGNGGATNASSPNCKVVVNDTDHDCGICGSQAWAWQNFTRGNSMLFMDAYLADGLGNNPSGTCVNAQCSVLDPQWTPVRNAMTDTLSYAKRMDLIHMTPQNGLSSTGFCLANAGVEYLAYQGSSGGFTVNLAAGTYSYEWFNPSNHTVAATGFVTVSAGSKAFTPPFSGDAVLYLKAQ